MKIILIIIALSIAAISLVGCTDIYSDPGYPVVSGGSNIHQSHHASYHPHHYFGGHYGPGPVVHTSQAGGIKQSHF